MGELFDEFSVCCAGGLSKHARQIAFLAALQRGKFFQQMLRGLERCPLGRLEICNRTNRRRNHGTGLRLPTLAGALSAWFQGASLLARMPRPVAWPFRLSRLRARTRVILCYFACYEVVTSAGRSMCNVAHRPADDLLTSVQIATCPISVPRFATIDAHQETPGAPWRRAPWLVSSAPGQSGGLLFRGAQRRCDARAPLVRGIQLRVDENRWA